jgi:hypothetical protein
LAGTLLQREKEQQRDLGSRTMNVVTSYFVGGGGGGSSDSAPSSSSFRIGSIRVPSMSSWVDWVSSEESETFASVGSVASDRAAGKELQHQPKRKSNPRLLALVSSGNDETTNSASHDNGRSSSVESVPERHHDAVVPDDNRPHDSGSDRDDREFQELCAALRSNGDPSTAPTSVTIGDKRPLSKAWPNASKWNRCGWKI